MKNQPAIADLSDAELRAEVNATGCASCLAFASFFAMSWVSLYALCRLEGSPPWLVALSPLVATIGAWFSARMLDRLVVSRRSVERAREGTRELHRREDGPRDPQTSTRPT